MDIFYRLLKILPAFIQGSLYKNKEYNTHANKEYALKELNFIQFSHPKFYGTISVDIDSQKYSISELLALCKSNNLPNFNIIVKTTKGYHLHWFLDDNSLIWKNNIYLTALRKKILDKLNTIFDGDKHSAGFIFRNPLKHEHYILNENLIDIIEFNTTVTKIYNKPKKINFKNTIDIDSIEEGNRNNSLLEIIRGFMFRNWGRNIKYYDDYLQNINNQLATPLVSTEVSLIVASAFSFVTKNYNTKYKNIDQAKKNRALAKDKAIKTYNKMIKNSKDISYIDYLRKNYSLNKLSKLLEVDRKTLKKYYKKLEKYILKIINAVKIYITNKFYIIKKYTGISTPKLGYINTS